MLLLIAMIILNSIVFGQEYIKITREEQRQCIKWYSENQYKDSIILELNHAINIQDTIIDICTHENKAITDTLAVARLDIIKQQKKVKRNRKMAIGGISGFIATLILLFAIK